MLTIFLAVFSAVSGMATLFLFWEEMRSRRRFGWKQMEALVRQLLEEIRVKGFRPDLILGVGRGGAILAGMLAGNMGHLPFAVVDTDLHQADGITRARIRFPDCCPALKDKKVLLVVGELWSGEDLRQGLEFVRRRHPAELKTATLLTHPAASIHPDFIGLKTDKPLAAPWRLTDDYRAKRG